MLDWYIQRSFSCLHSLFISRMLIAFLKLFFSAPSGRARFANCRTFFMQRLSHYFGVFSFPLYCLHYPIMAGLKALVTATNFCDPACTAIVICAILITLISSFCITTLFERLALQKRMIAALGSVFVKDAILVS
jgi:peptidoglycan/LPS O-acetylase OafA/YrhL